MDMEKKEEKMPPPVKMFLLFSGNSKDVRLLRSYPITVGIGEILHKISNFELRN